MIHVDRPQRVTPTTDWPRSWQARLFDTTGTGDTAELHGFARSIRIRVDAFDPRAPLPHYRLTWDEQRRALAAGATELDSMLITGVERRRLGTCPLCGRSRCHHAANRGGR